MLSSIEQLQYHLVFCTKYRYKLLNTDIANTLKEFLFKKQEQLKISIVSIAIECDHVHVLFKIASSQIDVNKIVQKIKGSSSYYIRRKFSSLQVYPTLFTASHFLATISNVSNTTIQEYINKQGIEEKEIIKRTFAYKVFNPNKAKKKQLDTWLSNVSSRPKGLQQTFADKDLDKHIFLRNDLVSLEKKKDKYWLNLPGGNGWKSTSIGLIGRELPEKYALKDSKIIKRGSGYCALLCIEEERIIKNNAYQSILSVDLGISHQITTVLMKNKIMKAVAYYGNEIKNLQHRRSERFSKLQKHNAKKHLSRKLGRYTRSIDDFVHKYTKTIAEKAKLNNALLVIGNIHNITKKWNKKQHQRNKTFRRKAKPTPYAKIMQRLFYKATLLNTQVVFQNEAYTSQRCSRCGELGCRKNESFECKTCGYKNQADLNAAINIASAYQRGYNDLVRQPRSVLETHRL